MATIRSALGSDSVSGSPSVNCAMSAVDDTLLGQDSGPTRLRDNSQLSSVRVH